MEGGENLLTHRIHTLKVKADQLQKLQYIGKQCLSSGAYSNANQELQALNLDRLKVPDWERDIIDNYWRVKKKMAHELFKELDILLKDIEKDYE